MTAPKLYELADQYATAMEVLADTDIPQEAIVDTLEGLAGEFKDKALSIAKLIKNLDVTIAGMKEAEANIKKRRESAESRVEWLREYLLSNMQKVNMPKVEDSYICIALQNNPKKVVIDDENIITDTFKNKMIVTTIDKKLIKQALEAGSAVPGARLVQEQRVVIK